MLAIETKKQQSWVGTAFTLWALVTVGCSGADAPDDIILAPPTTTDASNVVVPEAGSVLPSTPDAGTSVGVQDSGTGQPQPVDSGASVAMDATNATPDGGGDAVVSVSDEAGHDGSVVTDGAPPDGAMGADGGEDAALPRMDLGKGNGSDVVMIGDSWMNNSLQIEGTGGGISPALKTASKQPYRDYGVQGVMLLQDDLFGPAIPTQWDAALKANKNIKTVVMTGGGNDIIQGSSSLQTSCKNGTEECTKVLNQIGQTLGSMWLKMATAGVQDIVYILYSKSANTGRLKDIESNNAALKVLCDAVPLPTRCFTLNTDDLIKNDLAIDGIHPVAAANARVAKAVFDLMTSKGMRR
jgi:lysophospholipase L1-like esterase